MFVQPMTPVKANVTPLIYAIPVFCGILLILTVVLIIIVVKFRR